MKRTQPDIQLSEYDKKRALRDHFIMLMNGLLADRHARRDTHIIPASYFARLVTENTEHMYWTRPLDIFVDFPTARVCMNTDATQAWLATLDTELIRPYTSGLVANMPPLMLREVYEELFVRPVSYIPWSVFLDAFTKTVVTVAAALHARRLAEPRRVTVLMLKNSDVDKSNAWLAGLVWPTFAPLVDYVVSTGETVATFVHANEHSSSNNKGVDIADGVRALHRLFSGRSGNADGGGGGMSPEFVLFLKTFEIDVIYVDDMIYSGAQAAHNIEMKSAAAARVASRVHVYFAVPYATAAGYAAIRQHLAGQATLHIPDTTMFVPTYGAAVQPMVRRLLDHYQLRVELVRRLIATELVYDKPAIVFEHKRADIVSLPHFLIRDTGAGFPTDAPPLVLTSDKPFYKKKAFHWRSRNLGSSVDPRLTHFTQIRALFAAVHAAWQANPPCVSCGFKTPLKCRACGVVPYCSLACVRIGGAAHPHDDHQAWCQSALAVRLASLCLL